MPVQIIDLLPADVDEDVREELARGGLKTAFSLRTPAGWKAIDSPYEPRGEAQRALRDVQEGDDVLVLGAGSGFFAEELVARQVRSALIVTGVRALAERSRKRLEKKGDPVTEIRFLVAQDASAAWSGGVESWLGDHPDAKHVVHPREEQALPGFAGALALRIEARRRQLRREKPASVPARVLLPGCDGLLERELTAEFERRGAEVIPVDAFAKRRLSVEEVLDLLETHRPDLVLSTNNQGSDARGLVPEACELAGIPWATWLLDEPRFLVGREERLGAGRQRVGFAWDRNGLEGWPEIGFANVAPLPLATDAELFTPGEGDPDLAGRLVFVGSPRFASAEGFFHLLDRDPNAALVAEALEEEILARRRPPLDQRVAECLASLGLEGAFDPEALRRLPAYAVQQANRRYRVAALQSVAHLEPVVYGSGWEEWLPDSVELRGPVDYYRDLPRIYRSDALHLSLTNLQMRAWPNQRVFDVSAAGSAVLMDHLEGLSELFSGAEEPLVFEDIETLPGRAEELLRDAGERRHAAEAMHDAVLAGHTIRHRVDTILRVLAELP